MKPRSLDRRPAPRATPGAVPAPLTQLGRLPVARFMRDYWQRKPLLIRQAFSEGDAPLRWNELAALAQRDDVESRLVSAAGGRWLLRHGPFTARQLPARSRPHWTLLVQGVDLHLPAAHALLARFRFVADARLDDLMASYATDGGGVGPHVDSYDVFLLQAQGRRRWRIGRQRCSNRATCCTCRRGSPTRAWRSAATASPARSAFGRRAGANCSIPGSMPCLSAPNCAASMPIRARPWRGDPGACRRRWCRLRRQPWGGCGPAAPTPCVRCWRT